MNDEFIDKKIKRLNIFIQKLRMEHSVGYDDIHALRTLSREILSLISKESSLYLDLKKIIKLSNHIRDLDVFQYDFLESLHQHYKKSIDLKTLDEEISVQRDADLTLLLLYLREMILPKGDISIKNKETHQHIKKPALKFEKKRLHKYRIFVKTKLYIFKNRYPYEKAAIRKYTFLKDTLGDINDNFNALTIIKNLKIDAQSFHLIEKHVESENKKLFKLIKKIV